MISEFMKQQRIERIANSQFKPGVFVALVNHHWDRRIEAKRKVLKVHATGNFTTCTLTDQPSDRVWKPDMSGNSARLVGTSVGFRHAEHLEIWTPAHDEEIAARRSQRNRAARVEAAWTKLNAMKGQIDEHSLLAIEAALGLISSTPVEPELDLTEG